MSEKRKAGKAVHAQEAAGVVQENGASDVKDPKQQCEGLKAEESQLLMTCENTLKMHLGGFWPMGGALRTISEDRLYRENFKTFEEYCSGKWHLSDKHVYRLIKAATCMDKLKAEVDKDLPTSESQVRELLSCKEPDDWVKAWKKVLKATGGKGVTAEKVAEAVAKVLGKEAPQTPTVAETPKVETRDTEQTLTEVRELVTKALGIKKPSVKQLQDALEEIQERLAATEAA